jgi:putative hydrolase of the HAD superfamily
VRVKSKTFYNVPPHLIPLPQWGEETVFQINGMKYSAVIFDLGGTLNRGHYWFEYIDAARNLATVLSAPADDFVQLWMTQSDGLITGLFPSFQSYIKHICDQLSLNITDTIVNHASKIALSVTNNYFMTPRDGAMEVLSYLKSNSYKTGLITDCGPDIPEIWNDTPFAALIDVAVFSCSVGMNKEDPRIFQIAMEKLAVKPESCLYIADGMRNELANAAKLGMHSVQILVPDEIDDSPIREDWHGPVISSLKEVLNLIE